MLTKGIFVSDRSSVTADFHFFFFLSLIYLETAVCFVFNGSSVTAAGSNFFHRPSSCAVHFVFQQSRPLTADYVVLYLFIMAVFCFWFFADV
jgi:hypothetical protein